MEVRGCSERGWAARMALSCLESRDSGGTTESAWLLRLRLDNMKGTELLEDEENGRECVAATTEAGQQR